MLHTRFLLSKGFGWQDDLEFCPVVLDAPQNDDGVAGLSTHNDTTSPATTAPSTTSSTASLSSSTASPTASATATASASGRTASPLIHAPRAKKVLEIVNPHTGLRVGSPAARALQ